MLPTATLEVAKDNVRVTAISPGGINTPMTAEAHSEDVITRVEAAVPIGCMAESGEIVAGKLFLASDSASQFVGHDLHFDGGFTNVPPSIW